MPKKFIVLSCVCLFAATAHAEDAREVPQNQAQIQLSYAPVVKQTAPAVVNIYTKRKVVDVGLSPFMQDPLLRQFFGGQMGFGVVPRQRVVSSLGSGVILDKAGLVITNNHVVDGAQDIIVVMHDKREFEAKIERTDDQSDLALIRIEGKGESFPTLPLADSDALQVGDLVLAIGNPFGVGQTVTSGIVSALARSAKGIHDYNFFIQTDAAINPGNSGGALVDMQGRLAGINTAIYSRDGGSNGVGFAIPSKTVSAFLKHETTKEGRVVRPWLGAEFQSITQPIAESLGLDAPVGALVDKVEDGSPAAKAGLVSGDVVLGVNGQEVDDIKSLRYQVTTADVGSELTFSVLRGGEKKEILVKLEAPQEKPARDVRTLSGTHPLNGVTVANLNPALASELGMNTDERGVVVTKGKKGFGGGFQEGDKILQVNRTKITSTAQLVEATSTGGRAWRIQILRDGQVLTLAVVP